MVDALGPEGDEGRGVTAISPGKVSPSLRSRDFRMGKPSAVNPQNRRGRSLRGKTWGRETSQYPEEKKLISIP